ncbi:MAG TPA: AbrB/MazE/SpoVT family DNA-binding domain-containing protein [Bacillota bacterium]|nr:AbrB/MazE/SpoVT family DNA-binding domain-containing protein [Bacillota bacterium]
MAVVSGRTKMSSRGQVVIPKFLREAAGMREGEEIDVVLDGQRLILSSGTPGEIKRKAAADAYC